MYFWYKLLTYLFYPFSYFYLFLRKFNKKEHNYRFKEKLSKIEEHRDSGFLIWFHVASVGESLSILPLIENLEKEQKIKKILITSITLSSAEVLQKRIAKNKKIIHQFLPLDVPIFINKFLDHWSPNISIFVDSEIWPNLIFKIKERNIPLILINGRITKKTFNRWSILKSFSEKIFKKFDLCLAANTESEKFLKILGAQNIKNLGNLKFTNLKNNFQDSSELNLIKKTENRKIWCAASTHPSEEIFCAQTHIELKKTYKNILTIIIPRHINRVKKISSELSRLNLKIVFYSDLEKIKNDTDILLINSYGEALKFFKITNCVFLGGSLIAHGGQNPIEPSRLGCKIFHGPNVNNFTEIYNYLKTLGVTNEVNSPVELNQSLVAELGSDRVNNNEIVEKIENYGENILNNVIKELKKYI